MDTLPPISSPSSSDSANLSSSQSLSPAILLCQLHGQRLFLTLCSIAGFLIAAAIAFLLPTTYTATATFIPPGAEYQSSALGAISSQLSSLGGAASFLGGGKGQGDLFIAILKSRTIADAIIQRFHLLEENHVKKLSTVEKQLASNSLFTSGSKDPLITIQVTDRNPDRARDVANAYVEIVQSESQHLAVTENAQRRLFFEQRLRQEKDALADAEVALKQVQEHTGLIAPAGQTTSQIQASAQVQAQITERETQLAALLHEETQENPEVISLQHEVGSLRAKAAQLANGNAKDAGQMSAANVPAAEMEYIRKQREVKYHETIFDALAKQYEAARLDEAKDAPLQVLDWAVAPDTKSGPHRSLLMLLGLFLGLCAGMLRMLWKVLRIE